MKRGEIWWVSLDPTSGREQQGLRPVLIVSADRFNELTKCPIVVPITNGGSFARSRGFAVELADTRTTGIVRCDQPRVLDIPARNGRFAEKVPDGIIDDVIARLAAIIE